MLSFRDLPKTNYWAILLGYDGGRKRMYRKDVNFPAVFDRIDSTAIRQREEMIQKQKKIECKNKL